MYRASVSIRRVFDVCWETRYPAHVLLRVIFLSVCLTTLLSLCRSVYLCLSVGPSACVCASAERAETTCARDSRVETLSLTRTTSRLYTRRTTYVYTSRNDQYRTSCFDWSSHCSLVTSDSRSAVHGRPRELYVWSPHAQTNASECNAEQTDGHAD